MKFVVICASILAFSLPVFAGRDGGGEKGGRDGGVEDGRRDGGRGGEPINSGASVERWSSIEKIECGNANEALSITGGLDMVQIAKDKDGFLSWTVSTEMGTMELVATNPSNVVSCSRSALGTIGEDTYSCAVYRCDFPGRDRRHRRDR